MHIWTITDDKAGNQIQASALANTIKNAILKRSRAKTPPEITITHQTVSCTLPWRFLPPTLWQRNTTAIAQKIVPSDTADYPDMVISCGRQSIGISRYLRDTSDGKTFTVHIQNPRVDFGDFDVVVAPAHDNVTGENVIVSDGSISHINRANLDIIKAETAEKYAHLPHPIISVAIGGGNSAYEITPEFVESASVKLRVIAQDTGGSLLITPSRRTGDANIAKFKKTLSYVNGVFWDGTGENPYQEFLAHAHMCIVTNDSVNMITDGIAGENPVYILNLPSKPSLFRRGQKFRTFIKWAMDSGLAHSIEKITEHAHARRRVKLGKQSQTETIARDILARYTDHKNK